MPAEALRSKASELGFDRIRFTRVAVPGPGIADFDRFLAEGRQADMVYLARGRDARADPTELLPGARSAIVLGVDYAWPRPPDPGGLTGKVACYAWGRDYHNLIGKRLRKLVRHVRQTWPGHDAYAGVDSRPLLERAWAAESGLAFLGKNCCAIVPGETSYLFLAVVLTTLELPPDPPRADLTRHCGGCTRCLDVCPTKAFTAPGQLDARRCISYLTIEHRGSIAPELRPLLGRWVFGCDDCQEICPHNPDDLTLRGHSKQADLAPRPGHAWLDLPWVLQTSDDDLSRHFLGSPIRRAHPVGLKRNAALVLGNLADPTARPALDVAERHPDPVVADAARWALDRL